MQEENQVNRSNNKTIAIVIAVVVIILIGYLILKGGGTEPMVENTPQTVSTDTLENVIVQPANVAGATSEAEKLPSGMPNGIPVETENIWESYSMTYPSRNLVQYSVSFYSSASLAEKFAEYDQYMTAAGYEFGRDGKSEANGILYGVKDGDDLSVYLTTQDGRTSVQLTYLDRQ